MLKAEEHDNFKASFFLESVEKTARYILLSFSPWICYVFGLLSVCLRFCKLKLKQSNLTSHTKTGRHWTSTESSGVKHHEKCQRKANRRDWFQFCFVQLISVV